MKTARTKYPRRSKFPAGVLLLRPVETETDLLARKVTPVAPLLLQVELDTVVLTLAAAQEEEDAADGEVKIEDIVVGKNSEGENAATQTMLEQGARELKKEIMSYYQIRESQISILTEG